MVRDLVREFVGVREEELYLRDAGQGCDDVGDLNCREALPLEELAGGGAEAIQVTRPAGVSGLACGHYQSGADSAPAHRFIHVERAYQGRIDFRLYSDHADRVVAEVCNQVTRCGPFDSVGGQAAARQHRAHEFYVAGLLYYQFACAMLAYRHPVLAIYFFSGGKSCTPASSTTVIALTGHERAAATIIESPAAVALTTSDLPSSSS